LYIYCFMHETHTPITYTPILFFHIQGARTDKSDRDAERSLIWQRGTARGQHAHV